MKENGKNATSSKLRSLFTQSSSQRQKLILRKNCDMKKRPPRLMTKAQSGFISWTPKKDTLKRTGVKTMADEEGRKGDPTK